MNIPKRVAELRYELELVEASIRDFESLEKARQSSEVLTKKPVKSIAPICSHTVEAEAVDGEKPIVVPG
jgi:hypothetical protein